MRRGRRRLHGGPGAGLEGPGGSGAAVLGRRLVRLRRRAEGGRFPGLTLPGRATIRGAGNCALSRPPAGGPARTEQPLRVGDDPRPGGG
ncbi:hypothetical protein SBRY_20607 [Actinacidiphila bryophytorum]|uniref:Uncharacterized protein n=1 Tax=Actinacidiphila bryophytorum TaxID=1436133 RepID=A0A9W4E4Z0_9ACTN|nr:hypothetical protein SBRY_20607 [Actinacidiphila bryophytorum]